MWRDRPTPESDRLARYWNQLATGGSGQPGKIGESDIDPTLVQTISWLARIDDTRSASAEFSRRFETEFLNLIGTASGQASPKSSRTVASRETLQRAEARSEPLRFPDAHSQRRRVLVSIAAGLLLFLALGIAYYARDHFGESQDTNVILAPSSAIDVPMDRGNPARSGVMPGPGVSTGLEASWHFEAGLGDISAPAVVGDTIFITSGSDIGGGSGNGGSIVAIDVLTGSERWRFPTEQAIGGTPAVAGGIVYAGDMSGIVYALDAGSGEELWRQDLQSGWTSAPVVVGDTVLIATARYRASLHIAAQDGTVVVGSGLVGQPEDGFRLYAFDRTTGQEQWYSGDDLSGQPGLFAFNAESGALTWHFEMSSFESGPAIYDGRVYAGSTLDATVYALDLTTGDEDWHAPLGQDLPLNSSPAVSGGSVIVTTATGSIVCLDASSGEERWRANAGHITLNSSAIVVDGAVYVVDTAHGVIALSAADGSVLWSEQLDLTGQVGRVPRHRERQSLHRHIAQGRFGIFRHALGLHGFGRHQQGGVMSSRKPGRCLTLRAPPHCSHCAG